MGKLLYVHQSTISRIETGNLSPTLGLVNQWLAALYSNKDEVAHILDLFDLSLDDPLNYRAIVGHGVASKQMDLHVRERSSGQIRSFEISLVPGILQTPSYAASVFTSFGVKEADLGEAVEARRFRQRILEDSDRCFVFCFLEYVLYTMPGGPDVQLKQLVKLRGHCADPGIEIRIIVPNAGLPTAAVHSFTILDEVYVTGETAFREDVATGSSVSAYVKLFDSLVARAATVEQSARLIDRAIRFVKQPL